MWSTPHLNVTLTPLVPCLLSYQHWKNAGLMSLNVPAASAYPPPSSVTRKTTVRMAQMRRRAPNPLAAVTPSSATTWSVCRPSGAAMETRIVPMGLTSGRRTAWDILTRRPPTAAPPNSSVRMGSASTAAGGVTEASTVPTIRMNTTAVRWLLWSSANLSSCRKSLNLTRIKQKAEPNRCSLLFLEYT